MLHQLWLISKAIPLKWTMTSLNKRSLRIQKLLFQLNLQGLSVTMTVCSKLLRKNVTFLQLLASGKRSLTVSLLSQIAPMLWVQPTKGNQLVPLQTLRHSLSTLSRTLQLLKEEVLLGKLIQLLMMKKCTRNSKSYLFMVKQKMR